MSIHPSLNASEKDRKQRSVLKRIERLKVMSEKNQWKDTDAVFGLPKIKTLKIKIKKEKAEKAAATATGEAPAAGAAPAAKEGAAKSGAKAAEKK